MTIFLTRFRELSGAFLLLLFPFAMWAQNPTVSGKVTDEGGNPLIGVTLAAKGTSTGTLTDIDGMYSLTFPADAGEVTLVVSYIGFATQNISFDFSQTALQTRDIVLLPDVMNLDEVVVTGASAATSKKQLGNAIATVDQTQISRSGATGLDQALSGKISGALINQNSGNPAGGISITLRGNSTVFGSSDPLYIIDGVIVDNSSPEVLDLGGYAQNRLVDFNPQDVERIEILKGAAAAAIYGSRASNGVVQIFTKRGQQGKPKVTFSTSVRVNELRKEIEENMEPVRYATPTNPQASELIPTERFKMQDYIFDRGMGTDNYLSIRGGSGDTRYFFSGSAFYNEGIIRNTDFSRYTAKLNLDQVLNDWASVSVGLNFSNNNSNEVPNGGLAAFYGSLTGFNFNNNYFDPRADAGGNYLSPAGFVANPVEVIETFDFGQQTNRFTGNFQLKLTPFKGFSVDYIMGYDTYTQQGEGFIPVGTNSQTLGWARTGQVNTLLFNNDLNIRYNTQIGSSIESNTLLGATVQYDRSTNLAITANALSPVVNSTNAGTVIARNDSEAERAIQGAFLQQTFGLDGKLFVTGAIRVDAASTFGSAERTQMYPKASVSYLISEESFWKESLGNTFSTFKLRASYGESGNLSALAAYERLSNYLPVPINGTTGLVPSTRLGNDGLKPERQKELELGLDVGMFKNRLGFELSVYDVEVEDLLLTRTLANSTGFETRLENVGTMTNKGMELLVRAAPIMNARFRWNVMATYSRNRNEVNGIEGNQIALPKSFGVSLARNGEPIGILDGFYYARDAQGNILLDANGLPSRALDANGNVDRKTIGDPNPDWIGSLVNELSYKNFNLRVQFDAVQGFDIFNFTDRVNSRSSFGGGWRDAQELRGELAPGYNNAAYNIWDRYIEDGSFVKLRELALTYSWQPKYEGISNVAVSFIGRNLLSFDNYTGWDPETSASGQQNGVRGFDFNEVPIPRTWQFGLTLEF